MFRFLWTPPLETLVTSSQNQTKFSRVISSNPRYRFAVLKQATSSISLPNIYILEHYYSPIEKLMCFLVRSPNKNLIKNYRISILNREIKGNKLTFESFTNTFDNFGHISNFMNSDLKKVFLITLDQLREFCFICEEDKTWYFSLHVEIL